MALVSALTLVLAACAGSEDPDPSAPAGSAVPGSASPGAPERDEIRVGPWAVDVVAVDTDATDSVLAASTANRPPRGRYLLATVEATYAGPRKRADAVFDLTWSFTDLDGAVYEEVYALGPNADESTKAAPGETVTVDVSFDVAAGAAEGGTLTVEALGKKAVISRDFPVEG